MAWELPIMKLPGLAAGADLSAQQFRGVKLTAANTVGAIAADTDAVLGVLQNNPTAGQTAEVMTVGVTRMAASAAIAVGAPVGVAADGRAVTRALGTDTTKHVIGTALEAAAAAGDIIAVYINIVPNRAS